MLSAVKKVKMEIVSGCALVAGDAKSPNVYMVVLRYCGRKLAVPQADRKRKPPNLTAVLEALLDDSSLHDDCRSFEHWCSECDCDPGDPVSAREHRQAGWYADALKNLLGPELYAKSIAEWKEQQSPVYDDAVDRPAAAQRTN